jgi:hypothetical protein
MASADRDRDADDLQVFVGERWSVGNGSGRLADFADRASVPELSTVRRSRLSSWRTSPTMIRDGRIRSASLTNRRSLISGHYPHVEVPEVTAERFSAWVGS